MSPRLTARFCCSSAFRCFAEMGLRRCMVVVVVVAGQRMKDISAIQVAASVSVSYVLLLLQMAFHHQPAFSHIFLSSDSRCHSICILLPDTHHSLSPSSKYPILAPHDSLIRFSPSSETELQLLKHRFPRHTHETSRRRKEEGEPISLSLWLQTPFVRKRQGSLPPLL